MKKTNSLITVYADIENGCGEIVTKKEFDDLPALLRADILKDWIFFLDQQYQSAKEDIFKK